MKAAKKLNFQIIINGKAGRTLSANGMESIYKQFNTWAKAQGSTIIEDDNAVGMMKWQTPKGIAEIVLVN